MGPGLWFRPQPCTELLTVPAVLPMYVTGHKRGHEAVQLDVHTINKATDNYGKKMNGDGGSTFEIIPHLEEKQLKVCAS